MQVAGTPALYIFCRQEAGLEKKVSGTAEEVPIKMGNVIKEMFDQSTETFFRLNIFLTTNMTISANYIAAAVQADLYFSLRMM